MATELYDPNRINVKSLPSFVTKGGHDARRLVGDRLKPGLDPEQTSELPVRGGAVYDVDGDRVAVHRDDGTLHAVSAVALMLAASCRGTTSSGHGIAPVTDPASQPMERRGKARLHSRSRRGSCSVSRIARLKSRRGSCSVSRIARLKTKLSGLVTHRLLDSAADGAR